MSNSFETDNNGIYTYHRGASMSSQYTHTKIPADVWKLIEEYYKTYKADFLRPVPDNPVRNELNRHVVMGMKMLKDLLEIHVEKEVVDHG